MLLKHNEIDKEHVQTHIYDREIDKEHVQTHIYDKEMNKEHVQSENKLHTPYNNKQQVCLLDSLSN